MKGKLTLKRIQEIEELIHSIKDKNTIEAIQERKVLFKMIESLEFKLKRD